METRGWTCHVDIFSDCSFAYEMDRGGVRDQSART